MIPNRVDESFLSGAEPADLAEFGFPRDAKVVLYVGRLDEQKNPLLAIDAFKVLAANDPLARLLVVGIGPLEAETRNRASSLKANVAFAGYRNDVPSLMKASRCLLLSSRWEGMPNVVLEAVAIGLPVVASPADGVSEAMDGGHNGIIVSEATPAALASGLNEVLAGSHYSLSERPVSQTVYQKRVVSVSLAEEYGRLYESLLKHGVPGDAGHSPVVTSGAL